MLAATFLPFRKHLHPPRQDRRVGSALVWDLSTTGVITLPPWFLLFCFLPSFLLTGVEWQCPYTGEPSLNGFASYFHSFRLFASWGHFDLQPRGQNLTFKLSLCWLAGNAGSLSLHGWRWMSPSGLSLRLPSSGKFSWLFQPISCIPLATCVFLP